MWVVSFTPQPLYSMWKNHGNIIYDLDLCLWVWCSFIWNEQARSTFCIPRERERVQELCLVILWCCCSKVYIVSIHSTRQISFAVHCLTCVQEIRFELLPHSANLTVVFVLFGLCKNFPQKFSIKIRGPFENFVDWRKCTAFMQSCITAAYCLQFEHKFVNMLTH